MSEATFPPLMHGEAVPSGVDPFEKACLQAQMGCDAGLVLYRLDPDTLRAALVFAPDVLLEDAVAMLPLCAVGFQNALGALAPPEVAVHLEWSGGIRINGARCGDVVMRASGQDPKAVPDWLVVGLTIPLWPTSEDTGHTPDQTALYAEGCADVDAVSLLESWTRHTLSQINRWSEEGAGPLHKEWRGLAHDMGEEIEVFGQNGTFLGVDERFGMLLRHGEITQLLPLTRLLEDPE